MFDVQGGAPQVTLMTLNEVLKAVNGKLLSKTEENTFVFTGVACDSRKVQKSYLFFPLIGTQDGHNYIPQAIENGTSGIFVTDYYADFHQNEIKEFSKKGITVISVGHTMYALQRLASAYVQKFPNLIRVGITGSSGKTTTKEIAVNVLSQKYSVIYNEGNLNSETGLPLSVFNIRSNHEVGVFEMGMNRKGEISELASVLYPQYGIITNIGTAHIGILGSRQLIADEKKQIFKFFTKNSIGYIPADDDFVDFLSESKGTIKRIGLDIISQKNDEGLNGYSFNYKGEKISLPLCGLHNLKNTIPVIALAEDLGLSVEQIKTGLETVKPMFGRNQIISGDLTIIQDCYNANPDSMNAAIDFCDSLTWNGKKIVVLADMLELGDESEKEHSAIGKRIDNSSFDFVIFFGHEMGFASKEVKNKKFFCVEKTDDESINLVIQQITENSSKGDLVLLKGSRGMQLERITNLIKK